MDVTPMCFFEGNRQTPTQFGRLSFADTPQFLGKISAFQEEFVHDFVIASCSSPKGGELTSRSTP